MNTTTTTPKRNRVIPYVPTPDEVALPPVAATGLFPPVPNVAAALLTGRHALELTLPTRQPVLGHWMKQGDLGYLYAPRGAGKSWLAMLIARAVATGNPLGEWQAGAAPRPAYYFDAEMNLPDVQDRLRSLDLGVDGFFLLSNERLFMDQQHGLNIADHSHQQAISAALPDGCLFIIDNLSTAQLGMAENDNDAFDTLRDWLLTLRHRFITVIIVHHAGRNGLMRGSSRREDMAHWILSLKEGGHSDLMHKTAFTTTFTKCRNCTAALARPLFWTLDTSSTPLTLTCASNEPHDVLLDHIRNGISRASELAEIMDVAQGTISKWAAKLQRLGHIIVHKREYLPADE